MTNEEFATQLIDSESVQLRELATEYLALRDALQDERAKCRRYMQCLLKRIGEMETLREGPEDHVALLIQQRVETQRAIGRTMARYSKEYGIP